MLCGLVIPSSLINSSVEEFSYIGHNKSPFPFLMHIIIQSLGIIIIWPLCIYFLSGKNAKKIITITFLILTFISVINVFLFPGEYGFLTVMFKFSGSLSASGIESFINITALLITAFLVIIIMFQYKKVILSAAVIIAGSFIIVSAYNYINIYFKYKNLNHQNVSVNVNSYEKKYNFSKDGKNVLIIMLDRAVNGLVPYVFEEKPELYKSYDGFTWYKNNVSYGIYTIFGLPSVFGGYEYTPFEIQKRSGIPLVDKHNEALLMLPRIFSDIEYNVTVTDPSFANYRNNPDLDIFIPYPDIKADNIIGKYNKLWLDNNNVVFENDLTEIINSYLIRFSFLKISPVIIRNFIYDGGMWLTVRKENFSNTVLSNYIALDILPCITNINDNSNNLNIVFNNLTHENNNFFQAPDYIPVQDVTNIGSGYFANNKNYHVFIASIILLGKWFDYLKENEIYDNTRIIIASDHGNMFIRIPDHITLPNRQYLEYITPLLMVKDFNDSGPLKTDNTFMTNADVPLLALKSIIENPVNPWTGNKIKSDKENGAVITSSLMYMFHRQQKNMFSIQNSEWLHVHTDIFNPANWSFFNP